MFEKVSVAITEVLEDKKIIQSSTKEVCAYGLRQIFSTIFNAGTMLLIGFLMIDCQVKCNTIREKNFEAPRRESEN